jgi:hypothetical protein
VSGLAELVSWAQRQHRQPLWMPLTTELRWLALKGLRVVEEISVWVHGEKQDLGWSAFR